MNERWMQQAGRGHCGNPKTTYPAFNPWASRHACRLDLPGAGPEFKKVMLTATVSAAAAPGMQSSKAAGVKAAGPVHCAL